MQPALEVGHDPALLNEKIKFRGKYLCTEQFRKLITLMCQNIYLHAPTKEDLIFEIDEQTEKKKLDNVKQQLWSRNVGADEQKF